MPLPFESISHGTVSFGFFNIETDLLLLNDLFFFSTEYCEAVSRMAKGEGNADLEALVQGYCIEDHASIGDLMGAIHGVRYTGFIGDLYRRFPFPKDPEAFKQNPEGEENRAVPEALIKEYGEPHEITLHGEEKEKFFSMDAYRFTRENFHELLRYVWRGGYPRWKDERKPPCVIAMKEAVEKSSHWLFSGISFHE